MTKTKVCPKCRNRQVRKKFSTNSQSSDGLDGWCLKCRRRAAANWKKSNPNYGSDWLRFKKYGMTRIEFDKRLQQQCNRCCVCLCPFVRPKQFKPKTWICVDHNHETGKIRGLLCHGCNRGLGFFKDSPKTLRAAADYLEQNS